MSQTIVESREVFVRRRQVEVNTQLADHLAARTTVRHPDGARFVPAEMFTDQEWWTQENDVFFRNTPIAVAVSSDLPNPGCYRAIMAAGVPLIVIRQADGSAKVLLNSCAHRGVRVVDGEGTAQNTLSCPYHAWTYGLDGKLLRVTQEATFGEFDKSCNALLEFPTQERHGLIFTMLNPNGEIDLDDHLGDLAPLLDAFGLDRLVNIGRHDLPHRMNWKIAVTTYFESYHVPFLHARSIAPAFVGNLALHETYGKRGQHHLTTWAYKGVADLPGADDEEFEQLAGDSASFTSIIYLFPNMILTAKGAGLGAYTNIVTIYPGAQIDEQITHWSAYGHPDPDEAVQAGNNHYREMMITALENEDYLTQPQAQDAFDSGFRAGLHYGANESILIGITRTWAEMLGRPHADRPA